MRATLCNICVNPDEYNNVFTGVDEANNTDISNLVMKVKSMATYD